MALRASFRPLPEPTQLGGYEGKKLSQGDEATSSFFAVTALYLGLSGKPNVETAQAAANGVYCHAERCWPKSAPSLSKGMKISQ